MSEPSSLESWSSVPQFSKLSSILYICTNVVHVASVFVPTISLVLLTKKLWEFFLICILHYYYFLSIKEYSTLWQKK